MIYNRLAMLENQCRTWRDPLAAVVYVPLFRAAYRSPPIIPTFRNTSLEDVIRGMDAFFYLMESTATCVMHVELVGQFLDPLNPEEYPINSLRNRALNMATTELTFMLDVDFVATPDLGLPEPGYRDPIVYNQMTEITAMKKALVLPAFEVFNRRQELHLGQNFARNLVLGEFHRRVYPPTTFSEEPSLKTLDVNIFPPSHRNLPKRVSLVHFFTLQWARASCGNCTVQEK